MDSVGVSLMEGIVWSLSDSAAISMATASDQRPWAAFNLLVQVSCKISNRVIVLTLRHFNSAIYSRETFYCLERKTCWNLIEFFRLTNIKTQMLCPCIGLIEASIYTWKAPLHPRCFEWTRFCSCFCCSCFCCCCCCCCFNCLIVDSIQHVNSRRILDQRVLRDGSRG